MKQEIRTAYYDRELMLEAYRFEGIAQPFPNHFHDYYVIGFVRTGTRRLFCRNTEYTIRTGDVLLFNPYDNHGCTQRDGGTFDYGAINLSARVMSALMSEVTGSGDLPVFPQPVLSDRRLERCLRSLHEMILSEAEKREKEEMLLLLISLLTEWVEAFDEPSGRGLSEYREEVEKACGFMERNFSEHISLEELCGCCHLSKSTLLRAFTGSRGVTPYRYLQSIRIGRAKSLLESGIAPAEAAIRTGFSDQSHFTNAFRRYIGLSPAAYRRLFI